MKNDVNGLVWITQLGLSVAAPLGGFTLLGVWLSQRFQTGKWVIAVFCIIGFFSAISGLRSTLKLLSDQEARKERREQAKKRGRDVSASQEPVVAFNQHE